MAIIAAQHIAAIIADNILPTAALYEIDAWDKVQQINNFEGWAFETPAALGNVMRHTGVQLDPTELRRAYDLAVELEAAQ